MSESLAVLSGVCILVGIQTLNLLEEILVFTLGKHLLVYEVFHFLIRWQDWELLVFQDYHVGSGVDVGSGIVWLQLGDKWKFPRHSIDWEEIKKTKTFPKK